MLNLISQVIKFFSISRHTQLEQRFHPQMGALLTPVTRIQKQFLGVPFQTLYKYRETYYGEVKDCDDCKVSRMRLGSD